MSELSENDVHELEHWLWTEARSCQTTSELLAALCMRLVALGIPVDRVLLSIRTIHPQIMATGYYWAAGQDVIAVNRAHDIVNDPSYLNSPFKRIFEGEDEIRWSLRAPVEELEHPVLQELAKDGYSDYLGLCLSFTDDTRNGIALATRREEGFDDAQVAFLKDVLRLASLLLEIQAERRIAATLLDTYLGHHAGQRVLRGEIRRGAGQRIRAVIWYSDLRGFTALSETMPMEDVIGTLNEYFDCMASAIHAHGGQVLKFIGDGILAIFPIQDAAFHHYSCRHALNAAMEIEDQIETINWRRSKEDRPALRYGLGLHVGELIYGNIGSSDRLDFTAIGPSVNLTARLEELSGSLGVPLVMSKEMADAAPGQFTVTSLGEHRVRGIENPVPAFTAKPAKHAAA